MLVPATCHSFVGSACGTSDGRPKTPNELRRVSAAVRRRRTDRLSRVVFLLLADGPLWVLDIDGDEVGLWNSSLKRILASGVHSLACEALFVDIVAGGGRRARCGGVCRRRGSLGTQRGVRVGVQLQLVGKRKPKTTVGVSGCIVAEGHPTCPPRRKWLFFELMRYYSTRSLRARAPRNWRSAALCGWSVIGIPIVGMFLIGSTTEVSWLSRFPICHRLLSQSIHALHISRAAKGTSVVILYYSWCSSPGHGQIFFAVKHFDWAQPLCTFFKSIPEAETAEVLQVLLSQLRIG